MNAPDSTAASSASTMEMCLRHLRPRARRRVCNGIECGGRLPHLVHLLPLALSSEAKQRIFRPSISGQSARTLSIPLLHNAPRAGQGAIRLQCLEIRPTKRFLFILPPSPATIAPWPPRLLRRQPDRTAPSPSYDLSPPPRLPYATAIRASPSLPQILPQRLE